MFGTRGGVGGASTEHALRRPHAGAETREELERLPDDVLRVIVDEARAKRRKQEQRRLREEEDRAAELADVAVDDSDDDDDVRRSVPKADPVAETVLDMGDGDDDALDALDALGEKREMDETQARAELARGVFAARLARRAGARRRRCLSISRDIGIGKKDAVAVIHPEDFERFVHRGGGAEGVDAREVARLYACCLPGRPGSRAAAADALDAHQLLRVVESGRWRRHWARYVRDARQRALDRGACAGALAVFGATSRDPFADAASDARLPNTFRGLARAIPRASPTPPSSARSARSAPSRSTRDSASRSSRCPCWRLCRAGEGLSRRTPRRGTSRASPSPSPSGEARPPSRSPRLSRWSPRRRWSMGVVALFLYVLRQPEHLLVDVLVPVVFAAFTTSLAAACAGAAADRRRGPVDSAREREGPAEPARSRGRVVLPDDTARVAQDDPRVVRGSTNMPLPNQERAGGGGFKRKPGVNGNGNPARRPRRDLRPAAEHRRGSRRGRTPGSGVSARRGSPARRRAAARRPRVGRGRRERA